MRISALLAREFIAFNIRARRGGVWDFVEL
jgi:hypothetical protein